MIAESEKSQNFRNIAPIRLKFHTSFGRVRIKIRFENHNRFLTSYGRLGTSKFSDVTDLRGRCSVTALVFGLESRHFNTQLYLINAIFYSRLNNFENRLTRFRFPDGFTSFILPSSTVPIHLSPTYPSSHFKPYKCASD